MGRIIDRRREMGRKLPYDAEVEYLESTGTQYIDTFYTLADNGRHCVIMECLCTGNYDSTQVIACYSAQGGCWFGNCVTQHFGVAGGGISTTDSSIRTEIRINWEYLKKTILYISDKTQSAGAPQSTTDTFKLFGIKNYMSHSKIYYCTIREQTTDILLHELIPVRKGQTGYLYDTVNGTLFSNAGTGSFILGPDKVALGGVST